MRQFILVSCLKNNPEGPKVYVITYDEAIAEIKTLRGDNLALQELSLDNLYRGHSQFSTTTHTWTFKEIILSAHT